MIATTINVPIWEYHKRDEVSSSQLSDFLDDPEAWYLIHQAREIPKQEATPAMEFGNIVHGIIEYSGQIDKFVVRRPEGFEGFKPRKGWQNAVRIPDELIREDGSIRTGKEYSEFKKTLDNPTLNLKEGEKGTLLLKPDEYDKHQEYAEWFEKHDGKKLLDHDEINPFEYVLDSIRSCPATRRWMNLHAEHKEASVLWHHRESGLDCRIRVDALDPAGVIVDWKTTTDIRPEKFAKQAFSLNYIAKAAFYQLGIEQLTGEIWPFVFVPIKNKPGYGVSPFEMPESQMADARSFVSQELERMARFDIDEYRAGKSINLLEG